MAYKGLKTRTDKIIAIFKMFFASPQFCMNIDYCIMQMSEITVFECFFYLSITRQERKL